MQRKYHLNENYFERIDREDKAYWLGMLMADGTIESRSSNCMILKLGLKESDQEHVEKFREDISSNYPIRMLHHKLGNTYQIALCNLKICKDLINVGCKPKKTYDLNFPKLENELLRHFIRGYFDGDGCVYLYRKFLRCEFAGLESFLLNIQKILYLNNIDSKIYKRKNCSISALQINKKEHVIKLFNFLYQDSSVYLYRKFNKFQSEIYK